MQSAHLVHDQWTEHDDGYATVQQYSLRQVFWIWAAAAIPMAVLAWIVAPQVADHLSGREPLGQAFLICLNLGLIWILALTLLLVKRERGALRWTDDRHCAPTGLEVMGAKPDRLQA